MKRGTPALFCALACIASAAAMPPAPSAPPLLMSVQPGHENDAEHAGQVAQGGAAYAAFVEQERTLQEAAAAAATPIDRMARRRALAMFYEQHGLCFEALALLSDAEAGPGVAARDLFRARCSLQTGRDEDALAVLGDADLSGEAAVIAAIANANLGAFGDALSHASMVPQSDVPARLRDAFSLATARAFLAAGKVGEARQALGVEGDETPARALLRARIAIAGDDGRRARGALEMFGEANSSLEGDVKLFLLENAAHRGRVAREEVMEQVSALRLRLVSADAHRAALKLEARYGDDAAAFAALRSIVDAYPQADDAAAAAEDLSSRLATLGDRRDLPAEEVARLFYENIEFAPPGADGDRLIREIAARLAALDLLAEAAELLDHQVFNRLRGAARAAHATDLARIHLDAGKPAEALRVIRATRIAGLPGETALRRMLIEAEALEASGRGEAALILLGDSESSEALALRADIAWRQGDWAAAGAGYAALFDNLRSDAPLARRAAVRAAAAFVLAKDDDAFSGLAASARERLGDAPEAALIEALAKDGAMSASFLDAYDKIYRDGVES